MGQVTSDEKPPGGAKKVRQGLSIDQSLLDRAQLERPAAQANFSDYVRKLIVADLAGGTELRPASDNHILLTLADRLLDPLEAQRLTLAMDALGPAVDQRQVLQTWLRAYLASMRQELSGFVAENDRVGDTGRKLGAAIAAGFRQESPPPAGPPTVPPRKPAGRE